MLHVKEKNHMSDLCVVLVLCVVFLPLVVYFLQKIKNQLAQQSTLIDLCTY